METETETVTNNNSAESQQKTETETDRIEREKSTGNSKPTETVTNNNGSESREKAETETDRIEREKSAGNSKPMNHIENESTEKISKPQTPPPPPQQKAAAAGVVKGGGVMAAVGHQPWMSMPYPAMMMQHQMMPAPPHYAPQYMQYHHHPAMMHHHHQQGMGVGMGAGGGGGSNGENKTIWVGDLYHWMDEDYLRNCFASTNEIASVKVIRNKHTGIPEGYGFVEFCTHEAAENVLQTYPRSVMPNAEQPFRLNWATFSMGEKRSNNGSDLSIFVGDLAADVTDTLLHETFSARYSSVKSAKVVMDANTGRSKGYGFVRFGDDNERTQAMTDMNGVHCSTRPMRIGPATPRKSSGYQQHFSPQGGYSNSASAQDGDTMNTTIFVGGLDPNVSDEDLRQPFSEYGEIVSVKIPVGRGCGFVQFASRGDAEEALQKLNGTVIGKQTVRLSWGRNPANKQSRGDFGNQWNGAYYGGPFYEGYGYPLPPPHDPSMYAAAYGAYPIYGTHQQQVS